eukprot:821627-Prymnesium_polylepis.3
MQRPRWCFELRVRGLRSPNWVDVSSYAARISFSASSYRSSAYSSRARSWSDDSECGWVAPSTWRVFSWLSSIRLCASSRSCCLYASSCPSYCNPRDS